MSSICCPPVELWVLKVLATVVESYDKYYVKLSSDPVTVTKDDSVSSPEPEPESEPKPSAEPEPEPEPSKAEVYTSCFKVTFQYFVIIIVYAEKVTFFA